MTLQDLGSIGELIGAIATVATLVYLAVQIRHNTRGMEQNSVVMRMSFENQIRDDGIQFRSMIAADPELVGIWRSGLTGDPKFSTTERDRFELLLVNVLSMLRAHYDALTRGLTTGERGAFLLAIARTPGFRQWWAQRGQGGEPAFRDWVEALQDRDHDKGLPAA